MAPSPFDGAVGALSYDRVVADRGRQPNSRASGSLPWACRLDRKGYAEVNPDDHRLADPPLPPARARPTPTPADKSLLALNAERDRRGP